MDDLGAAILGHIQIYNDTPGVLEGSPAEYKANMRWIIQVWPNGSR